MSRNVALGVLYFVTLALLLGHYWHAAVFTGVAAILVALLAPNDAQRDAWNRNHVRRVR